jgi:NADH-quinone oxidoreductase subunit N
MILILSKAGFEAENVDDFRGLNDRNPWLAFLMLLLMMSMAGVPFMVGFYAKLMVLQAIISQGMVWLAVYSVVFSVIGAFYYLRVVKVMYFDPPPEGAEPVRPPLDTEVAISVNGLLVLLLGLYPTALMTWCATAF